MILAGGWIAEGLSLNFVIVIFCGIVVFDLEVVFTCELAVVNDFLEGSRPRIARWPRSWHSRNLRGGRERVIDGNTTNSPRRRDTVALAPLFQGPRPKDRGSVGSTQVCRWPPGGVSGALRPPQSPQDLEETSLTSLWQPHRKVKQRGSKVRVSGPFLGQVRRWPQKPSHPHPLFPFRGFSFLESLTRFASGGATLQRAR